MRTASARYLGWYLLFLFLVLYSASAWVSINGGTADYSFVIVLPIAIGLILSHRWASWGAVVFGIGSTLFGVVMATAHSSQPLEGLYCRLGPLVVVEPSTLDVWVLTVSWFVLFGLPMTVLGASSLRSPTS